MKIIANEVFVNGYKIEPYIELENRIIHSYWKIVEESTKHTVREKIENLDYAVFLAENRLETKK